jgi:O-antigen/teichoic acid export membrane protein
MMTTAPDVAIPSHSEQASPGGRRLSINYLLLAGGESLAKIFSLIAFAYLGRILGPDRYGNLEFVISAMIFFTLPVDLGLSLYGAREVARDRRRAADLLSAVAALRLILASFSFALLLVLIVLFPGDIEIKLLAVLYGVSLFVEPLLVEWFFQAHDGMHWVVLSFMTRRAAFAAFVVVFVHRDSPLLRIGLCECGSAVAMAAVSLTVLRLRFGYKMPRPWQRHPALKAHLRQAAPIGLSHLAWALQWYCATLLMGWLAASEELGWFAASHRVIMALHTFVYLYFFNLLPSFSRGASRSSEYLRKLVSRSLSFTIWGGVLVALALTMVGGNVLSMAYGPKFLHGSQTLSILGWLIPVAMVGGHYRYLLFSCNQQHLELRCTMISAVTATVLGVALIPLYGARGGAAALLAASLVNCGLAYVFANRQIARIPCHQQLALPRLAVVPAVVCSTIAGKLNSWPSAAVAGGVYLALFGAWAGWHFHRGVSMAESARNPGHL